LKFLGGFKNVIVVKTGYLQVKVSTDSYFGNCVNNLCLAKNLKLNMQSHQNFLFVVKVACRILKINKDLKESLWIFFHSIVFANFQKVPHWLAISDFSIIFFTYCCLKLLRSPGPFRILRR